MAQLDTMTNSDSLRLGSVLSIQNESNGSMVFTPFTCVSEGMPQIRIGMGTLCYN